MKRKLSICILFILVILCFSCEKEFEEFSLLTVMVEENAINEGQEQWVYISEPSGKVLDSHKCKNGEVFELEGPATLETIDVTIFIHNSNGSGSSSISTLLGISAGRTLTIDGQEEFEAPEVIGTATIEIVNYHESRSPDASISFSNGTPGLTLSDRSVTEIGLLATVNIYSNPQELLMTGFRGGQGVYFKVEAMLPNQNLVIDFDSFKEYDQMIEIPAEFHEEGKTIGYYDDGRTYPLSSAEYLFLYGAETSLGYIEGYDSYYTTFNEFYGPSSITYQKRGDPARDVEFPSFTLALNDRTPGAFRFDASFDYTYQSVTWLYTAPGQSGISWTVLGDARSNGRLPAIANFIYDKYPELDLADFSFYELNCIQQLDEQNYADFVSNVLDNKGFDEYEHLVFTAY
jgi:hypothetical protein